MTPPPLSLPRSLSLLLLVAAGCQGGASADDSARAKMASDLVQCQNDRSALKEKISDLTVELQKLRAANEPKAPDPVAAPRPSESPKKLGEANIAPEALGRVVKKNSAGLRTCYEKGLKHNPNLQYVTAVKVRFDVSGAGTATDVAFSPHTDSEMEKCMGKTIAGWKFPTFTGQPVTIEAPVSLVAK